MLTKRIKCSHLNWAMWGVFTAFVGQLLFALCLSAQAPPDLFTATVNAIRNRQFDDALKLAHAGLQLAPQDYRLWTLKGIALSNVSKSRQALDAFDQALRLAPNYIPALQGAAQIEYQQGSKRAEPLLNHILELNPADRTSHAMLAVLDAKGRNCLGAVANFKQAGELVAQKPSALQEYGLCLATLGRFQEAIPIFQQVLDLEPNLPSARYNLALDAWKAGDTHAAIQTLLPLVQSGHADSEVLNLAADIYESDGDTPRAVELLRKEIVQNPKSLSAYLDFAALSFDHASYKVGIDMLNAGLTQLPQAAQLYLDRGVLYAQTGDYAKAMQDFETANRLDPQVSFAGTAEGLLQSQEHDQRGALSTLRNQAKQHRNDAMSQFLLAEALSRESKLKNSPEYWEEIQTAKRAAELDPTLVAAHDLLAVLYLRSGETRLAIEQCNLALNENPADQQAIYHLILALRRTDQKNKVPALVKRLASLQAASQKHLKQHYKLSDEPTMPGQTPPSD